jgi:acyl-CoA synthetase
MITDLRIDEGRKAEYYQKGYWDTETLNDIWNKTVEQFGDREYVSDDRGQRFTYKEVDDKASRLAAWLKESGVENGDVVSWQVPIWADFAYVYIAALKVGAVMHPLPRNFNEADLTYVMNTVESKAFICPTFYWKTDYEQQMKNFIKNVPSVKAVALMDKDAPVKDASYPSVAHILETYEPLTEPPESKSDEAVCILSTSGTTGKPKQVLFTHNTIKFSERVYVKGVLRTKADVMIMMSPLNHATGFFHGLLSNMMMGARVVLQEHFDADHAVELIQAEEGLVIVTIHTLGKMDAEGVKEVKLAQQLAAENDKQIVLLTAALPEEIQAWLYDNQIEGMDYLFADATAIKTMLRGNPGFMYVKDAVVVDKGRKADKLKIGN